MRSIQNSKNILHGIFPIVGTLRYGLIGKRIAVIGITGTDGKSSSVILTAAMLRAAGHRVAHFSSISYHDGLNEYPNVMKMTTPGHMQLQRFLKTALENGCTHAVLEITSQGILQHRHRGIGFTLVGITNITPEHIEAHGNFQLYTRTKVRLLESLLSERNKGAVIGEETYDAIKEFVPKNCAVSLVALGGVTVDAVQTVLQSEGPFGTTLQVSKGEEVVVVTSKLGGPFIAHNIAFAVRVASLCNVPLQAMRKAVESFEYIPGRFEVISKSPLIVVDYAHTLNALNTLLPYVRKYTKGTYIHVFGAAGGGRDRYKRPLLAQLSQANANISILTEENSFDEPVDDIIKDIQKGFSRSHSVYVELHREDAVRVGLSHLTSKDDTLLLTAKGSETVIAGPRHSKRPYTERTYIRWLFETTSSA